MTELQAELDARASWLHWSHEVISLGAPAAGAALTYTVVGAVQIEVLSVSFTYTASGNAANRIPFVAFLDQSGVSFGTFGTPYKLVASDAARVSFGVGVSQFGADSAARLGAGIPLLRLQDGLQVQLSATAINATDAITNARLYVRQATSEPAGDY